jgi:RNA polymerase sigma-70 factor, ECF subfamily
MTDLGGGPQRGEGQLRSAVTEFDDLVDRAQAGDHNSFTSLLRAADPQMRRLAGTLLGDRSATDDALQDAYLQAFRDFRTYRREAAFGSWLYTIVYRTCLRHLRRRDGRSEVQFEQAAETLDDQDPWERYVRADAIRQALGNLPAALAATVILVDGDGYSYDEAATILDVRAGTIASRLNRGRRALRRALGANDENRGEL